ncbi:MAG: transposase, partial [Bacillota bacterium]
PDPSHGESRENLDIMRIIDETHLEYPSWGYRKMTDHLRANHGAFVNVILIHWPRKSDPPALV